MGAVATPVGVTERHHQIATRPDGAKFVLSVVYRGTRDHGDLLSFDEALRSRAVVSWDIGTDSVVTFSSPDLPRERLSIRSSPRDSEISYGSLRWSVSRDASAKDIELLRSAVRGAIDGTFLLTIDRHFAGGGNRSSGSALLCPEPPLPRGDGEWECSVWFIRDGTLTDAPIDCEFDATFGFACDEAKPSEPVAVEISPDEE